MSKITYKVSKKIHEGKKTLCSVVFNFFDTRYYNFFVSAGGNGINLYNCLEGGVISPLHSYTDEDKEESFNIVSWASGVDGNPVVAAGGLKGRIRVLNLENFSVIKTLVGHEDSVTEIKTHPTIPQLVLSASMDGSVRLWNVETGICILIFAGSGVRGPSPVLNVDFNPRDKHSFVSGCMDTTIKIWSMTEVWAYVEYSFTWKHDPSNFPTQVVQYPVFTAKGGKYMLNCNRWFGDNYIISKSTLSEILLWQPQRTDNSPGEGALNVLLKLPAKHCTDRSIKFSCDLSMNYVSIGNGKGEIYVWDFQSHPPVLVTTLSHYKSKSVIKQTAMSTDGNIILAASDDGTLWRWDVKRV